MNLDILNIDYYRLTSHGGRAFDLYNRNNDKVYTIKKEEYQYIRLDPSVARCDDVEKWQSKK